MISIVTLLQFLLLIVCLAGTAFFAGVETGLISINRLRLRHLVRHKVPGAEILQDFLKKTDHLLGTTLVGTNLFTVTASVTAASLGARWFGAIGTSVSDAFITLILLVFCEYIPKAWFQAFPARRTLPFANLLKWSGAVFRPVSRTVTELAKALIPAHTAEQKSAEPFITREELVHLAQESAKSGALTPVEHHMIHGVFGLKMKTCGEIMIPREWIVYVDHDASVESMMQIAREKDVSRFPVYHKEKEQFVGIVHIFDLLAEENPAGKTAQNFMRPLQLVSTETPVDHVMPRMRLTRQPMVLVAGESNAYIVGLVTLEDVLEDVVGPL